MFNLGSSYFHVALTTVRHLLNAQGLHAMVCKKAPGKIARHHVFNDIIWRAVGAAGVPAVKEPSGLDRQDGKRPDGLTLIPWHGTVAVR